MVDHKIMHAQMYTLRLVHTHSFRFFCVVDMQLGLSFQVIIFVWLFFASLCRFFCVAGWPSSLLRQSIKVINNMCVGNKCTYANFVC